MQDPQVRAQRIGIRTSLMWFLRLGDRDNNIVNLLLTCKFIYTEAAPIFSSKNSFQFCRYSRYIPAFCTAAFTENVRSLTFGYIPDIPCQYRSYIHCPDDVLLRQAQTLAAECPRLQSCKIYLDIPCFVTEVIAPIMELNYRLWNGVRRIFSR